MTTEKLKRIYVTQEHADAFLRSLWPCGDMNYLASHTRSFLEGICGDIPKCLRFNDRSRYDVDTAETLSGVLHALADYISQGRK